MQGRYLKKVIDGFEPRTSQLDFGTDSDPDLDSLQDGYSISSTRRSK